MLGEYFDKIYVLNLKRRDDRLVTIKKRLISTKISNYEIFQAVDGNVIQKIWKSFFEKNYFFSNSNYLACAISHLSIYNDALAKSYKSILIIEDDVKILVNANKYFAKLQSEIPSEWDLLYLGFIPLSDDCTRWDYNVFSDRFISSQVFLAKNLWGLYGYGIGEDLMKETLKIYDEEFPMELDRFFVTRIQKKMKCYALTPQIFAAEDGYSDNSRTVETGMMERSVDSRYAKHTDYI
jgi:GR25 family glycosyltransferase involved in LPS biosynthesis